MLDPRIFRSEAGWRDDVRVREYNKKKRISDEVEINAIAWFAITLCVLFLSIFIPFLVIFAYVCIAVTVWYGIRWLLVRPQFPCLEDIGYVAPNACENERDAVQHVHGDTSVYDPACPECGHSGHCKWCRGSGLYNYYSRQDPKMHSTCNFCNGTGICSTCDGSGKLRRF